MTACAPDNDRTLIQTLTAQLRTRDHDPKYADNPIIDPYVRISKSPDGETEKTDRQLTDILRCMLATPYRLGQVHRDDNFSAWKLTGKRPGWRDLVANLKEGKAHGAFAWHTDRMMRQPRDLEELINFGSNGLILGSAQGEHDLGKSEDRFVLRILVAAACKASDDNARRAQRKREAVRTYGSLQGAGGKRPLGFPRSGVPEDVVALEREAILWASVELLAGRETVASVAREWRQRGILIEHNGEVYLPKASTVRHVMGRARNAGLIEHNGVVVGRAKDVQAIYSQDVYDALIGVLETQKRGRPTSEGHLGSGCLRCSGCGQKMSGANRSDKAYPDGSPVRRYSCTNELCEARQVIDGAKTDAWVTAITLDKLTSPDYHAMVTARSKALAVLEEEIEGVTELLSRLDAKLGAGGYGIGAAAFTRYETASAPLSVRLAELERERDAMVAAGAGEDIEDSEETKVREDWRVATVEEKRRLIRSVAPYGILVSPAGPGPRRGSDPTTRLAVLLEPWRAEA